MWLLEDALTVKERERERACTCKPSAPGSKQLWMEIRDRGDHYYRWELISAFSQSISKSSKSVLRYVYTCLRYGNIVKSLEPLTLSTKPCQHLELLLIIKVQVLS